MRSQRIPFFSCIVRPAKRGKGVRDGASKSLTAPDVPPSAGLSTFVMLYNEGPRKAALEPASASFPRGGSRRWRFKKSHQRRPLSKRGDALKWVRRAADGRPLSNLRVHGFPVFRVTRADAQPPALACRDQAERLAHKKKLALPGSTSGSPYNILDLSRTNNRLYTTLQQPTLPPTLLHTTPLHSLPILLFADRVAPQHRSRASHTPY